MPIKCNVLSLGSLQTHRDSSFVAEIVTDREERYTAPAPYVHQSDRDGAGEELVRQFLNPHNSRTPRRSLTLLKNVYVLPNAAIVTSNFNIIRESCFPYTGEWVPRFFSPWISEKIDGLYALLDGADLISEPTIYIREHGESGFFHWMHSVFPRFDLIYRHSLSSDLCILCQSQSSFQREALALLDLGGRRTIEPNLSKPQFFKELLFPSPLVEDGDFWLRPISVVNFYDALPLASASVKRRIYLTRSDANVRRISNEIDLLTELQLLGFECVEMGALDFACQLQLFRNCELVVAPHGAGLSHIVCMQSGGAVLEILHPRRFWPTYRALAARRGLRYGIVVGNEPVDPISGDTFDFSVSLDKVKAVLNELL